MKTAFLMAAMTALLMLIGEAFAGEQGMIMMFFFGCAGNIFMYWNSASMVLRQYDAKEVNASTAPHLYGMVERLAKKAELPMPKVYIINDPIPNAFATGRNPEHAVVAVNNSLVELLDEDELAGVLAHELSHVKHRDILISTIAGCMANMISGVARIAMWTGGSRDDDNRNPIAGILVLILAPLAAIILQMAVSRSREYEADKSGGEICGNPNALADALLKLEAYSRRGVLRNASKETAHMFIINPFNGVNLRNLMSTHPSTEERVKLLRQQARDMGVR